MIFDYVLEHGLAGASLELALVEQGVHAEGLPGIGDGVDQGVGVVLEQV